MNRIVSTKSNSIFLAIVLVTGTITAISPSFMLGAQAQQDYGGMDNRYNTYEPQPGYPIQYSENENNSYEPSYEKEVYETPSYGNNNYETPSYGNNNYEPHEYPSYKPDYEPEYPSYGKDSYKSKDSSNSVSLNKLNCINNNVNINGNNTGDINVGNSGSSASSPGTGEGYLGVGSSDRNYGEGYDDGYKKDQGFSCIINNNNINNNFGAGNTTDGNEILTCGECFTENLEPQQLSALNVALTTDIGITITIGGQLIIINSLGELCDELEGITAAELTAAVNEVFDDANINLDEATISELISCIATALGID